MLCTLQKDFVLFVDGTSEMRQSRITAMFSREFCACMAPSSNQLKSAEFSYKSNAQVCRHQVLGSISKIHLKEVQSQA